MRRTLTVATAAFLVAGLSACSSKSPTSTDNAAKATTAKTAITASSALTQIVQKVTTAKASGTVTAAGDPNHLLGRPGQYTSKTTFTDTRVKASDVVGAEKGAVELGGAIEVFDSESDAQARAKYIQTVTKSLPALAEYDYVDGVLLVRVSHYLTPAQAAEYKTATSSLG
ncbi:hypothetical protein [Streptomyces sp. NPDC047042]|uniref:hypothetical protein n=1 Tax=Streptomyces sp. NPDC047042 TaxID=3154807 RepID=UPI0033C6E59E